MTAPTKDYGNASEWAGVVKDTTNSAANSLQSASAYANSKKEAKEAKRRTLANLLNQSLKRNQNLYQIGQDHTDNMNDYQSQAMQQVARGFVEAMQGSTGY